MWLVDHGQVQAVRVQGHAPVAAPSLKPTQVAGSGCCTEPCKQQLQGLTTALTTHTWVHTSSAR
jgi:hypothetical protein